jgi:hypothetical protein
LLTKTRATKNQWLTDFFRVFSYRLAEIAETALGNRTETGNGVYPVTGLSSMGIARRYAGLSKWAFCKA